MNRLRMGSDQYGLFVYDQKWEKRIGKTMPENITFYNKLKEDDASKHSQGKKESSDDGKSNVGCGSVLLCFLFMFCMMWFAMMVDSLCK